MIKIVLLTLAFGIASAVPVPVGPGIPGGAVTTSHHHTATAHHGIGYGAGYGLGGFGYPAFPGYGGYSAIGGLGYGAYGFPQAKAITQVSTTAVRPAFYGFY